jgi:hypothetical protein
MIKLHPGQSAVYRSIFLDKQQRNTTVVTSRGWGKSFFGGVAASTAVSELTQMPSDIPNKDVYIIAPTYEQVTDIYYPLLCYQLGMDQYAIKNSKDSGRFEFPNRTQLHLVSYEAIERMRGKGAYFVINDEPSSWTKGIGFKEAWEGIIQPCIATRWSKKRARELGAPNAGRSLTIGTPKGYNYLYDMFNFPENDSDWRSFHFDYTTSPLLDPEEIERIKHNIDPLKFAREYKASFEESGASVFYCFDRKVHVRSDVPDFLEDEDVHIGIDFNVGLQCSSVFALRGGQMHWIDEFKGHPDTENLARAIVNRYPNKRIYAYPDPTGRSRKTSAAVGKTDFTILESKGIITRARQKSPAIVDSVAAVNRKLRTAADDISMFIHPRCQGIINSLERTVWSENSSDNATIDKSLGEEHFSDSVRYPTEFLFPVTAGTKLTARSHWF